MLRYLTGCFGVAVLVIIAFFSLPPVERTVVDHDLREIRITLWLSRLTIREVGGQLVRLDSGIGRRGGGPILTSSPATAEEQVLWRRHFS